MYPIPTYHLAAWEASCWLLERAGRNLLQSLAWCPIGTASGHNASKQKLAAWRIAVPLAESPDLLTLINLGIAPTLQVGQDVLGFGTANWMMFVAHPWMKPYGQWWQEMQLVDDFCPCPKFVTGRPNLSRLGAPLYAAVNPSRPLLHPRRPKHSTAWPAVQPLAENLPKSCPQCYLAWHGQDVMAQTKPHSQTHAISIKDLKTFAQSQALLDVPCKNW